MPYKWKRKGKRRKKRKWNKKKTSNIDANRSLAAAVKRSSHISPGSKFVKFEDILTYCWWIHEDVCHCSAVLKDGSLSHIIIPIEPENFRWFIPDGKFHCCYLLQSMSNTRKTYIGYTVDPVNRIRKHNGEIKGGAKKTRSGRPWKMLLYISGFINNHLALRFEWKLQHPTQRRYGVNGNLLTIANELCKPEWIRSQFVVTWLVPGYKFVNVPNITEIQED